MHRHPTIRRLILGAAMAAAACAGPHPAAAADAAPPKPVPPGADLQAVLDEGRDLLLEAGKVYPLKNALVFKKPGQTIGTAGARHLSEYATLRIDAPECPNLVETNAQDGVVVERVILDGNRYSLSTMASRDLHALVFLGGRNAKDQVVRHCVMMSARTWTTLKLHEPATGLRVESNIILGVGSDVHGNGRDGRERPMSWGDGVSCAARDSVIRDNLIIDPTDGAIVLFGAPGSLVEENVVACISRESLGGVNLVDALPSYGIDGDVNRTDYRGTVVRGNLFDAFGGRIHIAVPMGSPVWSPGGIGKTLVGATVTGNAVTGGAAAYGFVANGVDGFTVTGNTSSASYSGIAEGRGPQAPPDDPGPFLYTADAVGNSVLQPEFVASKRHLVHLLRCNIIRPNILGYRTAYDYGAAELEAVVQAAYLEMLGRSPTAKQSSHATTWLREARGNADELRRSMMVSPSFTSRYGFVPPEELHPYRLRLWLQTLDDVRRDHLARHGDFPSAKQLYAQALEKLHRE